MTGGNPWLDPAPTAPAAEAGGDGFVLEFADVGEFFDELVRPTYRRRLSAERLWCADWFLHAEVIARLEGLWRSYERARVEDEWTGISAWQRDFLDHHLGVLMAADGPFQLCVDGHQDLPMLPSNPRPPGLFG